MNLTGEYRIAAPRPQVWEALNDPEVLKASIPGCDELEKLSDTEFAAKVTSRIGAIRARFTGKVTLSDIDPPHSYRIAGEGQGGVAGFARGSAVVRLIEDGDGVTVLRYEAKADVGGKLAGVGSRVILAVAKKMADEFFGAFTRELGGEAPAPVPAAAEAPPAPEATARPSGPAPQRPAWALPTVAAASVLAVILLGLLSGGG